MRSQTPPTCDAPEKLNFHLILFWCRKTSIFCLFQLFEASRISLSRPLEFIPLSLLIIFGVSLFLVNMQRPLINESVSKDSVTLIWIARIIKQDKRHHNFQLSCSTYSGQKKSMPTLENGGLSGISLLPGKSNINFWPLAAF